MWMKLRLLGWKRAPIELLLGLGLRWAKVATLLGRWLELMLKLLLLGPVVVDAGLQHIHMAIQVLIIHKCLARALLCK